MADADHLVSSCGHAAWDPMSLRDLRVFGSAGQGTDTTRSDLDILATRAPNIGLLTIAEFAFAAEQLLGVPVDVVTDGGLPADHPIMRSAVVA